MITFGFLNSNDAPRLQILLEKCVDYLSFQDEGPVQQNAATELLESVPEGVRPSNKSVIGIFQADTKTLIGVIDLIEHYQEIGTATLGLMLLEPESRKRGIGRLAYQQLEVLLLERGISKIRLAVLFGNENGLSFWKSLGFKETGEIKPYRSNRFQVLEKHCCENSGKTEKNFDPNKQ